jgi:hypothetical protein
VATGPPGVPAAPATPHLLAGPDNWGADTTSDGDRIVWARLDLPGKAVPDPGRAPYVSHLTSGELERARRELAASLALARPDSPARVPILAHMTAIDTEIAGRAGDRTRSKCDGGVKEVAAGRAARQ